MFSGCLMMDGVELNWAHLRGLKLDFWGLDDVHCVERREERGGLMISILGTSPVTLNYWTRVGMA